MPEIYQVQQEWLTDTWAQIVERPTREEAIATAEQQMGNGRMIGVRSRWRVLRCEVEWESGNDGK